MNGQRTHRGRCMAGARRASKSSCAGSAAQRARGRATGARRAVSFLPAREALEKRLSSMMETRLDNVSNRWLEHWVECKDFMEAISTRQEDAEEQQRTRDASGHSSS